MQPQSEEVELSGSPADQKESAHDILQFFEAGLVILLTVAIAALAIYTGFWVLLSCDGTMTNRIARVIRFVNENWRFDIVIALVLFFRPVYGFLSEVEEALGIKRRRLKSKDKPSGTYGN